MRARSLKPSIFKNELLAVADPLYTVIFEGLWCAADREGRLEDRPAKLHMEINPGRAFEGTDRSITWLSDNGFIVRYAVGGVRYIQICNFSKHQKPHVNEKPSVIPAQVCDQGSKSEPLTAEPSTDNCTTKVASEHDQGTKHLALTPDSGLLTPDCSLWETRASSDGVTDHGTALTEQTASTEPWREVEGLDIPEFERFMAFAANHAKRKRYSEGARYQLAKDLVGWARGNPETQRLIVDQSIRADHVVLYPLKDSQARAGPGRKSFDERLAALDERNTA